MSLTQTEGRLARESTIGYSGAPRDRTNKEKRLKLVKNKSRLLSWAAEPPKIAVGTFSEQIFIFSQFVLSRGPRNTLLYFLWPSGPCLRIGTS